MKSFRAVYFFLLIFTALLSSSLTATAEPSWARKTLAEMSLDEKIGQLFMVAAYVDSEYASREIGNPQIIQEIDNYITQYHVGGLAYVGPSECIKQVVLTNHYQEISKYPILIAQDLEWGLSMRIKDGMSFPKNITLGAVKDNRLIYDMGREIARQANLIGVHMNLSPVLDVNIEPENISINIRSFGASPQEVAKKGIAMLQGLQDGGMISSAKHFPGLGDISVDPHLGLPISNHYRKRLKDVELYPFVQAIKAGVLSIQTEHLIVPALEPDPNTPSSLSKRVINDLLKTELGFKGLVLSGALRMKALTEHFSDKEIVLKAFLAGNDMLLMPQDFPKAHQILKTAVLENSITENEIDERVLKVLQLKEKAKLNVQRIVKMPLMEQLHSDSAKALRKLLFQNAVSLTRNGDHLVPFSFPKNEAVAYVQFGEAPSSSSYVDLLSKKFKLDAFLLPLEYEDANEIEALQKKLESYSRIILAIYPADPRRIEQIRLLNENKLKEELKNFRVHGIPESLKRMLHILRHYNKKTIVTFFGNPFGLHFLDDYSTLIMAYEPDQDAAEAALSILMGKSEY